MALEMKSQTDISSSALLPEQPLSKGPNVYSRYRLPSTTSTDTTNSSLNNNTNNDIKHSITSSSNYFSASTESLTTFHKDLTPSAAIRDRYYQAHKFLKDDSASTLIEEEDLSYKEETIEGNILDYRPGDSMLYIKKPEDNTPSVYSVNGSVISLHTEYNKSTDNNSISSIRTVDDQLQGRSTSSLLGRNLNNFASKTVKKVSRSSSIFRTLDKNKKPTTTNEHFVPVRDLPSIKPQGDNGSIRTVGGTSLLSRLSRSTAPMRAKLFPLTSRQNTAENKLLVLPGRKRMAESVFNMPFHSSTTATTTITKQQQQQQQMTLDYRKKVNQTIEKAHSFSFPKTLSASSSASSTMSTITNANVYVEEPASMNNTKNNNSNHEYRGAPIVYPALLSKVAEAFQERMITSTKTKDSITYKDVFDGKEAVDKLAFIIKSNDRNLALLLGRALDAQKFFHDVNYEHRIRDSKSELYQFKQDRLDRRPKSGIATAAGATKSSGVVTNEKMEDDMTLPNGIFTLLTDCYSPTCTREKLCYSSRCPRRIEQAKRNADQRGHQREASNSYLINQQEDRLWISSVPKSISDTLSKDEKKRQENIFELVYTENDFVGDLTYMKEQWIEPLLSEDSDVTGDNSTFVNAIFWNVTEVLSVSASLSKALVERQSKAKVVDQIGDIMLEYATKFEPFVRYGAHQIIGKYVFESEKATNPSFAEFVAKTERLPISRKLELNGYLTKPTTRLGRYNLLLREVLKNTAKGHPDQETIPKVMTIISKFLADVNRETGKTENSFNLQLLNDRLLNKNMSSFDLDLTAPERKLVMKGTWKKGSGSESSDMLVYLLDHCILIIKPKQNDEKYKLYRKPIPLALLSIAFPDQTKRASTIIPLGRPSNVSLVDIHNYASCHNLASANTASGNNNNPTDTSNHTINSTIIVQSNNVSNHKNGFPISFVHLGKQSSGSPLTLYAPTLAARKQWAEKIESQRKTLVEKHKVFKVEPINQSFFNTFNKANCIAIFDGGKTLVLGGDKGVYLKKEGSGDELIRILVMDKVSQIDILESSNLFLVLADKILYAYSLDSLLSTEAGVKRKREISSHVSFFKVGKIIDKQVAPAGANDGTVTTKEGASVASSNGGVERPLVCFVRNSAMSSTIRALEPYEPTDTHKKKNLFSPLIRNSSESLKVYRNLYIPGEASSIHYFKNIICVGSARGFQMVNLNSTEVQSVLDPNDESNNSLLASFENTKPISMFRHKDGNILLCYSELAFYIDKKGKRVKKNWSIIWEGHPSAFAFRFPYIIAFNTNFIEVRHINSGDLLQVIPGNNIRCLRPDSTDQIYGVMDDRIIGSEVVFELKLIDIHRRKISMIKNSKNCA